MPGPNEWLWHRILFHRCCKAASGYYDVAGFVRGLGIEVGGIPQWNTIGHPMNADTVVYALPRIGGELTNQGIGNDKISSIGCYMWVIGW